MLVVPNQTESVKRTGNRGCEHLTAKTEKSSACILCSLGKHHTQSPTANLRYHNCSDVSQSQPRAFTQHKRSFFFFFSSAEYFLSEWNEVQSSARNSAESGMVGGSALGA